MQTLTAPTAQDTIRQSIAAELVANHYTDAGRVYRGLAIAQRGDVTPVLPVGGRRVKACSPGNHHYVVRDGQCPCPDYQERQVPCKHLVAVAIYNTLAAELAWVRATRPPAPSLVRCPRCRRETRSALDARLIVATAECSQCVAGGPERPPVAFRPAWGYICDGCTRPTQRPSADGLCPTCVGVA